MKSTEIPDQYRRGWLHELDSRTNLARDLRGRYDAICDDLGGASELSYMSRSLVERFVWLERFLSLQEQRLAEGGDEAFEASRWIQAANSMMGIAKTLGLSRQARPVSLNDYLRSEAASQ